jgi:protein-S-isoprenylcysteine O-methyltransferase Ste14
MSDINKGKIFAIMQFVLLGVIFISSYLIHQDNISSSTMQYAGLILIVIGLAIAIIAVLTYKQMVTPNPYPLENITLRTSGIYGFIRHPMYLGVFILIVGWCLLFFSYCSVIFPVITLIFLAIKMNFEEKHLAEKFPEYKSYQKTTSKLFPNIY